tara:strand:- start:40 stop:255 length:216 start_codon:yes stop_codon:yes gene_type:complete
MENHTEIIIELENLIKHLTYEEDSDECEKCNKIGSFTDGTLYGDLVNIKNDELIDDASLGEYDVLCDSCLK